MDENKKNEVLDEETSEENVSIDEQENEKSVEDRASEILSGLNKSVLPDAVQDWDGVLPENENELEIVEEEPHIIDEIKIEEEEEDIPEEERCVLCGKRRRCTSISEDYEYCAQCRIKMLKRPFNAMGIIAVVLVVFVYLASFLTFTTRNVSVGAQALLAYMIEKNGEIDSAITTYEGTLLYAEQIGMPTSLKLVERLALLNDKAYGPSMAEEIAKTYLTSYEIEDSKVLSEIKKSHELFTETADACNAAIVNYYDPETGKIKAKESYAALEKLMADNPGKYDAGMIRYFMSNVATLDGDKDKEIQYLEEIRKEFPEKYWLYNESNALVDAYMDKGDFDSAMKVVDEILKLNKTHQEANWSKAQHAIMKGDTETAKKISEELNKLNTTKATAAAIDALIARLDGDYEEAINICTDAIDADNYNAEVYHQLVISMILNNKSETAYEMISEYHGYIYSNATSTDYEKYINIYALLTYLEDPEEFDNVKAHYESQGNALPFPKELEEYAEKNISLEEIFLKGDFDLT